MTNVMNKNKYRVGINAESRLQTSAMKDCKSLDSVLFLSKSLAACESRRGS